VVAIKTPVGFVSSADRSVQCGLVLDRTSFYSEAGGQLADLGLVTSPQGGEMSVEDVQQTQQYVLHSGVVAEGSIKVGDRVLLTVNAVCVNLILYHILFKLKQRCCRPVILPSL
jgi:alanyl-tRNA synthetase